MLECHVKNYLAINHRKSVLRPEENGYVNFQTFQRLIKAPFIISVRFECVLIHSTDCIDLVQTLKNIKIIFFVVTATN